MEKIVLKDVTNAKAIWLADDVGEVEFSRSRFNYHCIVATSGCDLRVKLSDFGVYSYGVTTVLRSASWRSNYGVHDYKVEMQQFSVLDAAMTAYHLHAAVPVAVGYTILLYPLQVHTHAWRE